jgi:prepilin-type N-terminal cleavage/methylation domain-containing protein
MQSDGNCAMMRSAAKTVRGFTLVELAVVIAIVALLLGALLVPLATQVQNRNIKETRLALKEIKEALMGFAITQGWLPCPDTDRDGLEDAVACSVNPNSVEGFLPWQDLVVPPTDAWGRVFRYAVTSEFTFPAIPGAPPADNRLDLSDWAAANITVFTRGDNPITGGVETKEIVLLTESAPAVVLSVGSNGFGGSRLGSPDLATAAAGTDEFTNVSLVFPPPITSPLTRSFVQRLHTPASAGCDDDIEGQPFCEYDDLLVWLSTPALLNRMVEARRLP